RGAPEGAERAQARDDAAWARDAAGHAPASVSAVARAPAARRGAAGWPRAYSAATRDRAASGGSVFTARPRGARADVRAARARERKPAVGPVGGVGPRRLDLRPQHQGQRARAARLLPRLRPHVWGR